MTHDEIIAVIQAHKEGKAIQIKTSGRDWSDWCDCTNPSWNFATCDYRVKPAEPREWWVNEYNLRKGPRFSDLHESKHIADLTAAADRVRVIHVREVLEDSK